MASKIIAVTGASGFIGAHLVPALIEAGYRVKALTRQPNQLDPRDGLTVVEGGHNDDQALEALLDEASAVIHLAGLIKARRPADFFEVNCGMTQKLVELTAKTAPDAHFLLLSSLAAREPEIGPYGASKAQAESEVAGSGLARWSIIRPPVVYGPGDDETLRFFRTVAKGWIPHPAGCSSRVSMIHVADLVRAIVTVLSKGPIAGPYELDDGALRGHSWLELGRVAASVFGRSAKPFGVPRSLMWFFGLMNELAGLAMGRAPMVTRAKVREFFHPDWVAAPPGLPSQLGWQPSISLEKGFEETIGSYLASDRV